LRCNRGPLTARLRIALLPMPAVGTFPGRAARGSVSLRKMACRSAATTGTIPEPCNTTSAIRTSSTPSDTPSFHPTGSGTFGEISVDRPSTAPWVRDGSAHLKRAWMCVRQMRPPGRGDFWILKITHAPSPKNLPKNGFCPGKGVAFLRKAFLQKKFQDRQLDSERFRSAPRTSQSDYGKLNS
jgi:hypothetical protein